MTFKTDIQDDIAEIINDTDAFGNVAVHTPAGGVAQPAFNCLIGEAILHGDDEQNIVSQEDASITAVAADVSLVKYHDKITINSIEYEVINNPVEDSTLSAVSVIWLRREIETLI